MSQQPNPPLLRSILKTSPQYRCKTTSSNTQPTPLSRYTGSRNYIYPGRKPGWQNEVAERIHQSYAQEEATRLEGELKIEEAAAKEFYRRQNNSIPAQIAYPSTREAAAESFYQRQDNSSSQSTIEETSGESFYHHQSTTTPGQIAYPTLPVSETGAVKKGTKKGVVSYPNLPASSMFGTGNSLGFNQARQEDGR